MIISPVKQPEPVSQYRENINPATSKLLHLSSSPHIRNSRSVPEIMSLVIISLIPAIISSFIFFGFRALFLLIVSVTTSVITEWSITKLMKKSSTVNDYSAVITGILLALSVSPALPWWMMAIGAVFSVGVVKMAFGGLGNNFLNPALAGRAFLTAAYPVAMSQWLAPRWGSLSGLNGISSATPLMNFKTAILNGSFSVVDFTEAIPNLLFGNVGGCIGETSAVAILIGASFLLFKRIISYRIPICFIATVFFLFWIFNGTGSWFTLGSIFVPFYQILSGGLMLGAFFMATDLVTSPITPNGQLIFGIFCGILTFLIREFGGYPDGVAYSILLMNLTVPYLNLYTRPRIYGEVKKSD